MSRAGFVGLAGRPNVGKSTLVNELVGDRVAIVSDHPQTTRRAVRGIVTGGREGMITGNEDDWQLVLVDLPGVQRPRDALTERMQRRVEREIADSDAILLMLNAEEGIGPGDRYIADVLLEARGDTPVIAAVNKADRLKPPQMVQVLAATEQLEVADEIFPISARAGSGLFPLTKRLAQLMPESPFLYPPEQRSDQPSQVRLAELIREQILRRTRDELPHAVEVEVSEPELRDDGLAEVHATAWVESESQKGIVIGHAGAMIKEIGTVARRELERELDSRVFLDLQVKVRKRWRRDEALLDRLGIE